MWQGIDQRRFPRAQYTCVVTLRQKGVSTPLSASTENVGMGGVCVLMEKSLDIFSPVELELNLEDGKPSVQARGTVVWVVRRRELKKGPSFDTGIEFSELTPQDRARLEAILDKFNANPSP